MRIFPFRIIIASLIAIALLWLLFGYFGVQALLTNTTVNDQLPPGLKEPGLNTFTSSTPSDLVTTPTSTQTALMGDFMQGDSTYRIRGNARIVMESRTQTLVLSNFDVTNGPDLFVYLVAASSTKNSDVKERTSQGQFVQLAALKGNRGNQTYTIPANLDIAEYPVVSIWCRRFSRNFGSALLETK